MDEFLNLQDSAKFLGVGRGQVKKIVKPISPVEGLLFRVSELEKVKEQLKKRPIKAGRPPKKKL